MADEKKGTGYLMKSIIMAMFFLFRLLSIK